MKKIFALIITIIVILIAFIFIFQENTFNEDIKQKVLHAIDNVSSYSYTANGTISEIVTNMENDTERFPFHSSWYKNYSTVNEFNINVDMINRELKGEWNNITIYYSNGTQYMKGSDYDFWSTLSGDHNWYGVSYLDKVDYILEKGKIKSLDDEIINGSDCYKLEISSIFENKELNRTYTSTILPSRSSNSSYDIIFNEEYTCNILYWIEKDTFLPKKVYIEIRYFVNETSYLSYLGNLTWNTTSYYKTTMFFENYNKPFDMELPWKDFQESAEELLNTFEYYNIDFGFGFNPSSNWTILDSSYYYGSIIPRMPFIPLRATVIKIQPSAIFTYQNRSYFNISFSIEPIDSHFESKNLSSKVENRLSEIEEIINQTDMTGDFIISQGNTTINGMKAYEIITNGSYGSYYEGMIFRSTNESKVISKEIYIQKDERIFKVKITGQEDLYYDYVTEIEDSLDSSLMIVTPYYYIDY